MTAMAVTERMTAEEYLARPEDPRERGWGLISGELIDMTDPSLPHELARMEILHALAINMLPLSAPYRDAQRHPIACQHNQYCPRNRAALGIHDPAPQACNLFSDAS